MNEIAFGEKTDANVGGSVGAVDECGIIAGTADGVTCYNNGEAMACRFPEYRDAANRLRVANNMAPHNLRLRG